MRSIPPSRDRSIIRGPVRQAPGFDEPIVAELFSIERLEQHGESLAAAQSLTREPRVGREISPRVAQNGRALLQAYRVLAQAIKDERSITPAAEWLVDNFHIVDEQLREIRDDLPADYYRELPKLADGHLEGYPRVLDVAWAYVAHTDSRFDPESLRRLVAAFQRVQPLTMGELWAIATSLRILLVENLRRVAEEIVRSRAARYRADEIADSLLGLGKESAESAAMSLRRLSRGALPTAARVQLFQRLRDQDPAVTPALGWLEEVIAAQGTTAEETVRLEHQRQAAMNVTVRNVITSMRLISWFDWAGFVESVSLVDQVLRSEGPFGEMDFATRDRYRHAIEELARGSGRTEVDVAQRAADMARGAADTARVAPTAVDGPGPTDAQRDPGYFLVADGRPAFERALGVRLPRAIRLRRAYLAGATPGYLGTLGLMTVAILAVPVLMSLGDGNAGSALIVVALLALVPASDLAIALVNHAVTNLLGPRSLPRLELVDGVPASLRTLVVVPTLLANEADVQGQIGRLEIHYLANPDGDLRFALLSDWLDAATESLPGDDALLATATAGIERLNARHGEAPGGGARFLLFHRRRRWNEAEGSWMGWERKRGKLHELNALLRGSTTTDILNNGRPGSIPPKDVRYVVTLDADTRLPRDVVARLVGTIAHPLNRATFDASTGRVVHGYGVLQPRITSTLPAERDASLYERIFSGAAGIDPYASAVSDVYQDLFREGSYTGKGIYDLHVFDEAMTDLVPENALLSHDLFEGIFARAGLVTDVELFDEFPSHYLVAVARQHRWARGDWQLLPWILGRARDATGRRRRSSIPSVGRWKMIDNLRRTLSAPLTLAALAVAWTLPSLSVSLWTGLILVATIIPAALPVTAGLLPRRQGISKRSHLQAVAADLGLAVAHILLAWTLLAHQAWLMGDAIVRALTRLYVTRRKLLEWTTAAQAKAAVDLSLPGFYRQMAGGVGLAVTVLILILALKPSAIVIGGPFVALWLLSPLVARWVSRPPSESARRQLSPDDAGTLRLIGRRTWRFFEIFVGPEDHALPPDNFQEDPKPVIAHRTSPTNIGLYLLATVTARDLGWIGTLEMVERLEATLATVSGLTRFRGHLYNWYDTRSLQPLEPTYVSSVDSGNLAGHLLTLANACRDMIDQPLPIEAALAGIGDAIGLTRQAAAAIGDDRRTQTLTRQHMLEALEMPADWAGPLPATPAAWRARLAALTAYARTLSDVVTALTAERGEGADSELVDWAEATRLVVDSHARDLAAVPASDGMTFSTIGEAFDTQADEPEQGTTGPMTLDRRLRAIAVQAHQLFGEMGFGFLFEPTRKLLSIGYRVTDGTLDPSCYDLLASEARLASFLAIAKGDIGAEHWFRLGRALTPVGRGSALISWSGSMFEYLMPALVMRAHPLSLLDQTYRLVVARQMRYATRRNVPWGISESGFNERDLDQTYQYSSFGVPGLGLKRGLTEDLVVAPYATGLGALIEPQAAVLNFARLSNAGAFGRFGFREAIDYTPRRLPEGASSATVNSYMAHHQGMLLVALGNVLNGSVMVERFHRDPIVQATELLLQERMPRDVLVARPRAEEVKGPADIRDVVPPVLRRFTSPHDAIPRTHLLSNGRYAVMVTAAGSGYSRWGNLAVTRWREDVTRDSWGSYLFLRDRHTGALWSAGHQPSGQEADTYEVDYAEDHAEFLRRDGSIATRLTIVVSTEHDAEIRRVSLTNLGSQTREIELTSYAEVVLATQAADVAHPAFQNLFVQTEFVPEVSALLATRRPRSAGERQVWAAHVAAIEDQVPGVIQYETDRARFLGRGRTVRSPAAVVDGRPLSNTVGPVLDPIFSIRLRVKLAPGATAHAIFSTVVAESRDEVLDLADKYREAATFERAATLAWTQAQVQLHHLGIEQDEANLFQRLANRILYSDPSLRPAPGLLAQNERGASGLWAMGISGDIPIVLVRIDEAEDLDIVRQLLRAHEYWRLKLLDVDLVIVNEHGASYAQDFQDSLETVVRTSQSSLVHETHEAHGGVHILRGDRLRPEDRTLLQAAARAVLLSRRGSLADQVIRLDRPDRIVPTEPAPPPAPVPATTGPAEPRPELEFFNGLGGFGDDGREYVVALGPGQATPAPWLNVIANPSFGFQVSESGAGYTWSENSRENQLTPWSNDAVSDPVSEAVYVRDDDTGELWGPTALPIRLEGSTYVARHGPGYSRFEHRHDGIGLDLVQFVALDDRLKIGVLRIENRSGRRRRLSVTAYAAWVLGTSRGAAAPQIVTDLEPETGALLARNPWNADLAGRVAFLDLGGRQTAWTCDRTEFLGRNGAADRPAALKRGHRLGGSVGAGLDPCAALQTSFELSDGAWTEVVVLLGEADTPAAVAELVRRGRSLNREATLRDVATHWDQALSTVKVRTPDRSMDILLNGWLLYQTIACRLWARTAFYQAGGAYGFRDQLQDVIALTISKPGLAREHLLRAAARQFSAGDAQHWWHPPTGRGVRTRISDDRLWLPYAVDRYIAATGDAGVLDEVVPFIDGPVLNAGQDDAYFQPEQSGESASLYEHCARAIDCSLAVGAHGLPLIGSGDWNDGMNRVGNEGRGESVWLGWFLHVVLSAMAPIAEARGEQPRAESWRAQMKGLRRALERSGWDGDWYRRAFFDDGTPLGSAVNAECRIDSIAQSWSVLSGAANPPHAERAMAAVEEYLVRPGDGLVLLFTPPFAHGDIDPGYIKGYLPGVRENGGQYTHGAIWSVMAFAQLGDGDKAGELFSILNPINHASTRAGVHRYKVEPYVMAADIYSEPPHVGRGGWTWYTGSAGWMYQAGVGSILGFRLRGPNLVIEPCIPRAWPRYEIDFAYHSSRYEIVVENPGGVSRGVVAAELDGKPLEGPGATIPLADDGRTHQVKVILG